MSNLNKNDDGFSVFEAILILIIVGLIGFVGWYVWHSKQATDKNLTVTNAPTVPHANSFKSASSSPTPSPTATSTFKIPELGIELVNVPASIKDLTYAQQESDSAVLSEKFSTTSLTTADPACSASQGTSIGLLGRINGTHDPNAAPSPAVFIKQFSGFWIEYAHPQAACSQSDTVEALHQAQMGTFSTLVTNPANVELIP